MYMLINCTFVYVYTWAWVPGSYMRLLSLCYWGFYVPCAPDPGGRQGGDCVVAGCTGGCRYDSLLCDRWGIVDLFEPANTALLWSLFFKTSYPVSCMYVRDFIVILLNTCYYICIYVSWRFLTKFYDMCNPEILCNCLFYLLFTCTLSEMLNKRCPINLSHHGKSSAMENELAWYIWYMPPIRMNRNLIETYTDDVIIELT